MASIERLKPGQILWDYHKYKCGNSNIKKEGEWPVKIIEIDLKSRNVLRSWNGNPPQWVSERNIKSYRVKRKKKR